MFAARLIDGGLFCGRQPFLLKVFPIGKIKRLFQRISPLYIAVELRRRGHLRNVLQRLNRRVNGGDFLHLRRNGALCPLLRRHGLLCSCGRRRLLRRGHRRMLGHSPVDQAFKHIRLNPSLLQLGFLILPPPALLEGQIFCLRGNGLPGIGVRLPLKHIRINFVHPCLIGPVVCVLLPRPPRRRLPVPLFGALLRRLGRFVRLFRERIFCGALALSRIIRVRLHRVFVLCGFLHGFFIIRRGRIVLFSAVISENLLILRVHFKCHCLFLTFMDFSAILCASSE